MAALTEQRRLQTSQSVEARLLTPRYIFRNVAPQEDVNV